MADLFHKATQNKLVPENSQNLQKLGFLWKKNLFCDRKTQVFAKRLCVGFFSRKRVKWCLWLKLLKTFEFRFAGIYGELNVSFFRKKPWFISKPKNLCHFFWNAFRMVFFCRISQLVRVLSLLESWLFFFRKTEFFQSRETWFIVSRLRLKQFSS